MINTDRLYNNEYLSNEIDLDNPFNINYYKVDKACSIFRGINHKLRQIILQSIREHGSIHVKALYNELHMDQAVLSQHLAILRKTGVVSVERQGKESHYSINYPRLIFINELSKGLFG